MKNIDMEEIKESIIPGKSSSAGHLKILSYNLEVLSSKDIPGDLSGHFRFMRIHFLKAFMERNRLEVLP